MFGDIRVCFSGEICFPDVLFYFSVGLVFGIRVLLKDDSRLLQLGDRMCPWVTEAVQAGDQKHPPSPLGHRVCACAYTHPPPQGGHEAERTPGKGLASSRAAHARLDCLAVSLGLSRDC